MVVVAEPFHDLEDHIVRDVAGQSTIHGEATGLYRKTRDSFKVRVPWALKLARTVMVRVEEATRVFVADLIRLGLTPMSVRTRSRMSPDMQEHDDILAHLHL